MLYIKTELKILEKLMEDLTASFTILALSNALMLPYPQIHRSVQSLLSRKIIKKIKKGKSIILSLDFESFKDEYLFAEIERKKNIFEKYPLLRLLEHDLDNSDYSQYVCILFGSYAEGKAARNSDIDLLFVIPEEYDYAKFDKSIKNSITLSKADVQITTEQGLIEMWNTPAKLNVGNEILKKHIILRGAEPFLRLRRKYYVG
jgi:predicted nucleotidyltransferase